MCRASIPLLLSAALAGALSAQDAPDFHEARRILQEGMAREAAPAAAFAVVRNGKIIAEEAIGWADSVNNRRATPDSPFLLASLNKTFETTLAMVLQSQHRIDLDRPVNEDRFGHRTVLAQGGNSGAQAWLRLVPSERVAAVVLVNKGVAFAGDATDAILAAILPKRAAAMKRRRARSVHDRADRRGACTHRHAVRLRSRARAGSKCQSIGPADSGRPRGVQSHRHETRDEDLPRSARGGLRRADRHAPAERQRAGWLGQLLDRDHATALAASAPAAGITKQ